MLLEGFLLTSNEGDRCLKKTFRSSFP